MSDAPRKIAPQITPETAAYWEAARRHELLVQQCTACGRHQFYPRILCTACGARDPIWVKASGRATVLSFTVIRREVTAAYAPDVPYVVALVELAEGPTMMSNIVGCAPEAVHIGMQLDVAFDDRDETLSVPVFRPLP